MKINEKTSLESALRGLLQKYGVVPAFKFHLDGLFDNDDNLYCVLPGWKLLVSQPKGKYIPLLPWRSKRSFIELRNLVENKVVENVSLIRFSFLSDNKWTIEAQLYRELDLIEFISGGKIASIHGVLKENKGGNVIVKLENGIICSVELSNQLPLGSSVLERHELIAERGAASDLVVDTQIPQSSIYLFSENGRAEFKDYDMELFGYAEEEIDLVRTAYSVIKDDKLRKASVAQHNRLTKLVKHAFKSEEEKRNINIKDTISNEAN